MKPSFTKLLLDSHIAPLLTEHGFRRRKSTWNRKVEGIVHMIDFEVSKMHQPEVAEMVTFSVGVGVDDVQEVLSAKVPSFYKSEHCVCHVRVGDVASYKYDKWWDLTPGSDIRTVAHDVARDLRLYCLPYLDRIDCLCAVRDCILDVKRFYPKAGLEPFHRMCLAVVYFLKGEQEQYNQVRGDLLCGKGLKYGRELWASRMREVAARLEK